MKTILVPVDFSVVSDATMSTALEIARAHNAEILLLHVLPPPVDYIGYPGSNAHAWLMKQAQVRRDLNRLISMAYARGVAATLKTMRGEAVPAILELARESYADLIVMGSHGHSTVYDLLIGSTSSGVLKMSTCPVTIVPSRMASASEKPKMQAAG